LIGGLGSSKKNERSRGIKSPLKTTGAGEGAERWTRALLQRHSFGKRCDVFKRKRERHDSDHVPVGCRGAARRGLTTHSSAREKKNEQKNVVKDSTSPAARGIREGSLEGGPNCNFRSESGWGATSPTSQIRPDWRKAKIHAQGKKPRLEGKEVGNRECPWELRKSTER